MPCGGSQKRKQYCFSGDVSSMFHLHSAWPNAHVKCTQTHTLRRNGFITVNRPSKVGEILNGWWITMGSHSRNFSNFTNTHTLSNSLSYTIILSLTLSNVSLTHYQTHSHIRNNGPLAHIIKIYMCYQTLSLEWLVMGSPIHFCKPIVSDSSFQPKSWLSPEGLIC